MKKFLSIFLSIIIFLSFCSCGSDKNRVDTNSSQTTDKIVIKAPTDNSVNGYRVSDSQNESTPDFTDTQSKTQENNDTLYYANTNSKKFHLKTCDSAQTILDKNLYISDNRDELIDKGYSPCGRCKP